MSKCCVAIIIIIIIIIRIIIKSAEHLLYASPEIHTLLAICFNAFIVHGFLPSSLTDSVILTTNLAAVVCVCAKFEHFLALRSYFESIRPENFVRIAKFQYAAFGPLFAFHCP